MLQSRLIGIKLLPAAVRWNHSGSERRGGSGKLLKRLAFTVVGVGAVSAATLVYALHDANFRRALESVHPWMPSVVGRVERALPENLNFDSVLAALRRGFDGANLFGIFGRQEIPAVRAPSPSSTAIKDFAAVHDSEFLSECDRIEKLVQTALSAKRKVIETAARRQSLLQKYIDDHAIGDEKALQRSYADLERDVKAEESAIRNAESNMKKLQSLLNETQRSIFTSPSTAQTEVSNRLSAWHDELSKTDAKMKVAMKFEKTYNEYAEIVEQGRWRYQSELRTVLPDLQSHDDLTEDELIALLAQSYVRLRTAESHAKEAEEREKRQLDKMLAQQAAELTAAYEQKVKRMKSEISDEKEQELQRQLKVAEQKHEEDLKKHLKQQAAVHSEHLNDSLKRLESRINAEHKRQMESKLARQAEAYHRRMESTFDAVVKISHALDARAEHDKLVQYSRKLLGVSKNFRDMIATGRPNVDRRRLKPLANEVIQIRDEFQNDNFVCVLLDSIPDQAIYYGVCSEQNLRERFAKVYRVCKRAAFMDESGGGVIRYLVSIGLSLFLVEPEVTVKPNDEIDVGKKVETMSVLRRADYCVKRNDFTTAIRLLNLLRGQPGILASRWIKDATNYAETLQVAEDLVSYANALTLRAVY